MYSTIKRKVHILLDPTESDGKLHKAINILIISLIILNAFAIIIETVKSVYIKNKIFFDYLELITIVVFSTEYILRVWSCTAIEKYSHPVWGRLKYIFSLGGLVDLIAILPFFIPYLVKYDLLFIRILRLFRFLRFLKLSRYFKASKVIARVFSSKKEELVLSLVIILFLIVSASILMYYTEHEVQPDKFSSIPETMWWSVATLTTVGYEHFYPITTLGKTLTSIISILGVGMFALPAGILASGFSDELKHGKNCEKFCPHCGKEIDEQHSLH